MYDMFHRMLLFAFSFIVTDFLMIYADFVEINTLFLLQIFDKEFSLIFYNCIMFFIIMFMEQWVVLGFLLLFMKKTLKRSSSKGRIIVSAAAGSFFGCIILLFLPEINIGKIFLVIFAASITVKLAFQLSGKKLVYFYRIFRNSSSNIRRCVDCHSGTRWRMDMGFGIFLQHRNIYTDVQSYMA